MADPNGPPIPTYPTAEPSSVLSFGDLIKEIAYKIGVANYGATGTGAAAVPTDPQDLDLCSRIVNKAIRMFIHDAPPPNGWRWIRPIAQVDLWPQISYDTAASPATYVNLTFNAGNNTTTLTLTTPNTGNVTTNPAFVPAFFESMELRNIYLNGNPPPSTPGYFPPVSPPPGGLIGTPYTILQYLSATQIVVDGNATGHGYPTNCPFSFPQLGDYTLPANFGGQYCGQITYIANTNRGMILDWTEEAEIRGRRQNYNIESGTPYVAAVRLMPTPSYKGLTNVSGLMTVRRRWELMTWRISSEYLSVIFPYVLHFQNMVNLTDVSPAPFAHDETIKAACLAVAEKEVTDAYGPDWEYYKEQCLPNSYRIDAMSAPKRLGYFGNPSMGGFMQNPISSFRNSWYQRPTVGVNGLS